MHTHVSLARAVSFRSRYAVHTLELPQASSYRNIRAVVSSLLSTMSLSACFLTDDGSSAISPDTVYSSLQSLQTPWIPPYIQAIQTGQRSLSEIEQLAYRMQMHPYTAGIILVSGHFKSLNGTHAAVALHHLRKRGYGLQANACSDADGSSSDGLLLLAAENPNEKEGNTASICMKRDAGVDCIVTQPPLCRRAWNAWVEAIQRQQISIPILVGTACLTSSQSVRFWLQMCNIEHENEDGTGNGSGSDVAELLNSVPEQRASEHAKIQSAFDSIECARDRMKQLAPNGAIGMHCMPVSPLGYRSLHQNMVRSSGT